MPTDKEVWELENAWMIKAALEVDRNIAAIPEPIKRMMFAEAPVIEIGYPNWIEEAA